MAPSLRHGLFRAGKTLADVLAAGLARHDRRILWADPKLPLFGKIRKAGACGIDLTTTAMTDQARDTFQQMADAAGIIPHIITHDIRRGGAKDLARIDPDIMKVATVGVIAGSRA